MELKDIIADLRHLALLGRGVDPKVSLGAVVDAAGRDGIGLLLFLPALAILLPVGFIPGVSSLCALLAMFSALHEVAGLRTLWLPDRIRNIRFDGGRLAGGLERMNAWVKRVDLLSRPRLAFLLRGRARILAAGASAVLAIAILVSGLVPLIDMALTVPMLCFGIAIRTGDGLIAAAGWAVFGILSGILMVLA